MKKAHKGFTLVELLIVIAILGTLSATMMVAVKGSTSKAKAVAIAANVEACKTAVEMYVGANEDMSGATVTGEIDTIIEGYVGTWKDFNRGNTTYTAEGTNSSTWKLIVDFSKEPDKEAIATALANIKGYGSYGATKTEQQEVDDGNGGTTTQNVDVPDPDNTVVKNGKFEVILATGKVNQLEVTP